MKFIKLSLVVAFLILWTHPAHAFVSPSITSEGTLSNGTYFGFFPQYGDINGDGYQDIVFAEYGASAQTGRIDIYYGNGSSYSATPNVTISAEAPQDALGGWDFGHGLAIADINHDGCDDLFIGAHANDEGGTNAGKLYIFYGDALLSGDKSASEADITNLGNLTNKKGAGVSTIIADLNNDTKNDLVFVAGTSVSTVSKVYVILNSNSSFDFDNPSFIKTVDNSPYTMLGMNGVQSGDYNGDGNRDLLISLFGSIGIQRLFLGTGTGDLVDSAIFTPEAAADQAGRWRSIHSADINGDGTDDFCIGAYYNDTIATNQGRVYCFFGRATFNPTYAMADADIVLNGQASNDNFGRSVFLYDVTGDSKPDLLIGAYQYNASAGNKHGKAFIYKNTNGTFGSNPWLSEIKTSGNTAYGVSVSAADWDYDGWTNIVVTQAGTASSGTGNPVVNFYDISHGSPSITSSLSSNTITGTVTESNADYTIAGVEWSTSSTTAGTWTDCSLTLSSFSCDISSAVDGTSKTIYVRTHDQNDLYMPPRLYASNTLPGTVVSTSTSNTTTEVIYQIPETSGGNSFSGPLSPTVDSDTGIQRVVSIIEPQTFSFNAYLSARTVVKTPKVTGQQIGKVQEIWYKAYPPRGTTLSAANIIPELQQKPSIVSLSYSETDLSSINPKSLRLAYSPNGTTWKILKNSVVDPVNHTVSVIHKIGGYYSIVATKGTTKSTPKPRPIRACVLNRCW